MTYLLSFKMYVAREAKPRDKHYSLYVCAQAHQILASYTAMISKNLAGGGGGTTGVRSNTAEADGASVGNGRLQGGAACATALQCMLRWRRRRRRLDLRVAGN